MKASSESEFISIMILPITSNTVINLKNTKIISIGSSFHIQNPLRNLKIILQEIQKIHSFFSICIQKLMKLKKKNFKIKVQINPQEQEGNTTTPYFS